MNRWTVISCCFFFSFHATGQQLIFKTYTVEDGLVSNPVRRILQDKKGFMWIATWEGLSKYDGDKFTNYTIANGLSHNLVNDMYESPDGKLYLAENNGMVDILQNDVVFKKAAFQKVVINRFYTTQNNRVYAVTDSAGLNEIKNGALVKPLQEFPHSSYSDISYINDSLLIGGSEGSLLILNRQFEFVAEIKKEHAYLTNKIYKDSKNRVWVGTNNGLKLLSIQQTGNHIPNFTLLAVPFNLPALREYMINDIMEDEKGNLWIGTSNGLVKMQPDNGLPDGRQGWQLFSEKDGLPSHDITCMYQDKEKNIWIGTSLGLVKLVTQNGIRIYSGNNKSASNNVSYLLRLKQDLFLIGTQTGTQLFNTASNHFYPVKVKDNFVYTGFVKNSRPLLFFVNDNRFGKYDTLNSLIENYILTAPPQSIVYCSVMDAHGNIFNGTHAGLVTRFQNKSYYGGNIPYRITDLLIDKKGYLWVATWGNGLYRIRYSNNNNKPDSNQLSLSIKDFSSLLPDKNVRCLYEDSKGNMWIGTRYGGIVQLIEKSGDQYSVQHINLQSGLMSNWGRTIAEDSNGCIWIGSDLGIDKLIPTGNSFRVFNFSRINNYFAQVNEISPENGHSLWFTTSNGLVNIIDGEIEKTPAPPAYITSVNLGDTSFKYSKYYAGTKVQLKYYQNQVEFEFSSPAFINEKQILYSYRLLGSADTAWSHPASLHAVSYASLQPGHYRFEVRTIGWNAESGALAGFVFMIQSPFWQTWWFYLLIGFVVLLFFYALYLYRIREFLKLQKIRNRIATDLHDDIGATLTNINLLSEISRKNLQQPLEAEKFLQRISEEVTGSSQALNDIIWNVNSRNDSMEEIMLRMRRYAADLFDNSNTLCHLAMDENVATKKLNMEQRRDVYLIYKEAMNNIIKHASASNVWISLQWQSGKLCMKIKDDGKGFEPVIISHRNGLKNIRSRTEKWKGSTAIEAAPGKGTLIEIIIPLAR